MAAPPSPAVPKLPFPATVVIMFVPAVTFRIRLLFVSAIYRFPDESTATPWGAARLAPEAALQSPPNPEVPFPIMFITTPDALNTYTWLADGTTLYTFP